MGNVTEESPRDIWNGDKFNEVRMMITAKAKRRIYVKNADFCLPQNDEDE